MESELLGNYLMIFFIGFITGRFTQYIIERVIRERNEPDTNPPQERPWEISPTKND